MEDILKQIAGKNRNSEKNNKPKQNFKKSEVKQKENGFKILISKKNQKTKHIKISVEHHKILKTISKKKKRPITEILEYILNHTLTS